MTNRLVEIATELDELDRLVAKKKDEYSPILNSWINTLRNEEPLNESDQELLEGLEETVNYLEEASEQLRKAYVSLSDAVE